MPLRELLRRHLRNHELTSGCLVESYPDSVYVLCIAFTELINDVNRKVMDRSKRLRIVFHRMNAFEDNLPKNSMQKIINWGVCRLDIKLNGNGILQNLKYFENFKTDQLHLHLFLSPSEKEELATAKKYSPKIITIVSNLIENTKNLNHLSFSSSEVINHLFSYQEFVSSLKSVSKFTYLRLEIVPENKIFSIILNFDRLNCLSVVCLKPHNLLYLTKLRYNGLRKLLVEVYGFYNELLSLASIMNETTLLIRAQAIRADMFTGYNKLCALLKLKQKIHICVRPTRLAVVFTSFTEDRCGLLKTTVAKSVLAAIVRDKLTTSRNAADLHISELTNPDGASYFYQALDIDML